MIRKKSNFKGIKKKIFEIIVWFECQQDFIFFFEWIEQILFYLNRTCYSWSIPLGEDEKKFAHLEVEKNKETKICFGLCFIFFSEIN